jgi:hypothetical protein
MRSISSSIKKKNNIPFLDDDRKHRTKIDEERPEDIISMLEPRLKNNTLKGLFTKKQDHRPKLKDVFEVKRTAFFFVVVPCI